jgi:inorganic pyrophosphatase
MAIAPPMGTHAIIAGEVKKMNIWHDICPEKITPEEFMAVVEIPAGSKKKYEMDKETGLLRLDRILYTSTHYPANYGFIPRTYADDGDPLDVLILCSESLDPMVMVNCYPIGVVRMLDSGRMDDKIIAIPVDDPTWKFYKDISALPPHILDEIVHFFEVYKNLENLDTAASEILGREGAVEIIKESLHTYEVHYCGKIV